MSNLIELAERVEKLTGADRETDALVWVAVHGGYIEHNGHHGVSSRRIMWCDDKGLVKHPVALGDGLWRERRSLGTIDAAPKLTASTDEVLVLIAEKLPDNVITSVTVVRANGGVQCIGIVTFVAGTATYKANAATPALALLIATLRALANTPTSRVAPLSASPQTSDAEPGMPKNPSNVEKQA